MDGSVDWSAVAFVPAKLVKVSDIFAASVLHFGVSAKDLRSSNRKRHYARARQVAMFLARELTEASLPMIGREFGGRDHTTVLFGARRIKAMMETNAEGMRDHVTAVRAMVLSGNPKAALRERDIQARYAAEEAQAHREADAAIKHAETMKKFHRIKQLADAGFIPADRAGRMLT